MPLDQTPLGLPLPHPDNNPREVDVPRLRTALTMLDTLVTGLQTDKADMAEVNTAITAAINALKAGAPEAYDTLIEIASKLGDNDDLVAGILTTLGLKANSTDVAAALAAEVTARDQAIAAEATARGLAIATALEGIDTTPSLFRSARTSNTMLGADDASKLIDITSGTFAQTLDAAETLGNGWFCYILNSGTGVVTLTPSASQLINGAVNLGVHVGQAYLLQCDGAGFNAVLISGDAIFIAESERPRATFEGAMTAGSWITRVLNTVRTNTISGASLASNQITLPAGTYEVDASVPAMSVDGHRCRLFNVTSSTEIAQGETMNAPTGTGVATRCAMSCVFSLSSQSAVRLDHIGRVSNSGQSAQGNVADIPGLPEIFSRIKIRKIR